MNILYVYYPRAILEKLLGGSSSRCRAHRDHTLYILRTRRSRRYVRHAHCAVIRISFATFGSKIPGPEAAVRALRICACAYVCSGSPFMCTVARSPAPRKLYNGRLIAAWGRGYMPVACAELTVYEARRMRYSNISRAMKFRDNWRY